MYEIFFVVPVSSGAVSFSGRESVCGPPERYIGLMLLLYLAVIASLWSRGWVNEEKV